MNSARRLAGEAFLLAAGFAVASTAFVVTTVLRAGAEAITLNRRVRGLADMIGELEDRFETVEAEHAAEVEAELAKMLERQ